MANISNIKIPDGTSYGFNADTLDGVHASELYPKKNIVAFSDSFSLRYPYIVDEENSGIFSEFARKTADKSVQEKSWRLYSIDGIKYATMRAYSDTEGQVIWDFVNGTADMSLRYNGKKVLVSGQQGNVYQIGTVKDMANGVAKDVATAFNPIIVVLYDAYGHVVTNGFSIAMGAKKFTLTPSNISIIGSTSAKWIAFG